MTIASAVAALGPSPLTEDAVRTHIFPLFSRTLAAPGIYLENHSLGRPLDQTEDDLREAAHLWQTKLGAAWTDWTQAEHDHRSRIAQILHAERPDCIVPKVSAGQGLRTVLNALPGTPRVLATTAEFDSVDIILKQYAAADRIQLQLVSVHTTDGALDLTALEDAIQRPSHASGAGPDLVIVPQVFFMTSQILPHLDRLAALCHQHGAHLLVDAYHSIGVFPVDVAAIEADFLIGGSYKYLRGGPGAGFLYLSPAALTSGLHPLDIGWFAKEQIFGFDRPNPPRFAAGGDAFLESTPAVFTYFQARAGQQFTLALGVDRIRAYTLDRLRRLQQYLAAEGIHAHGGDEHHGAFLTLHHDDSRALAEALHQRGVHTDARPQTLRLGPDLLSTDADLRSAAATLASILSQGQ
ncbi:MAG TPA: aminotransferase class V-fold PLP-dependent enzyme [Acidobacteriaceae bacterium]|jgi:kynureninase|nr:aminotransferase class V-fold PLP-dependent enzyme [Acidobacteriaceae bacterium]